MRGYGARRAGPDDDEIEFIVNVAREERAVNDGAGGEVLVREEIIVIGRLRLFGRADHARLHR